jgi:hypothetical protein
MEENAIVSTLHQLYNISISGVAGLSSASDFANEYREYHKGDNEAAIENLIDWQIAKSGMLGFVLNIGGLITLPVAIPADIASSAVIQFRMIAAIAHLRGHDISSDRVRTFALACLLGNSALEIVKEAGIQIGLKMSQRMLAQISGQLLTKINQAVGFRLITKAGTTGVINLTKWIPLVGGVVGGAFDAITTAQVGKAAKSLFPIIDDEGPVIEGKPEPIFPEPGAFQEGGQDERSDSI